jgi:hypothetical protein
MIRPLQFLRKVHRNHEKIFVGVDALPDVAIQVYGVQ